MRLDPKYFNLFIVVCAIITLVVIFYGSVSYHQNQAEILRENIGNTNLGEYYFTYITRDDSIRIGDLEGVPVIVDFWATWSGKSQNMHRTIADLQENNPDLVVLAAVVRDDDEMAIEYAEQHGYSFTYVQGTALYHELQVPGVPSQILIDKQGGFYDFQIGEDIQRLQEKVQSLVAR